MLKLIRSFFAHRRALKELRGLSDYYLADIGITRGDIFQMTKPDYSEFFKKFKKNPFDEYHEYLSQSSDLADLERRQRNLSRKGLI